MPRILLASILLSALASADEPDKLAKLRDSYDAAVQRATAPITKTYVTELEKLKSEFTKAAKLEDALAVSEELKKHQSLTPSSPIVAEPIKRLSSMNLEQFKAWLMTVEIAEQGADMNVIRYDGTVITLQSFKDTAPRPYSTATIDDVGKITIPFSNQKGIVEIDSKLKKATVTYTNGGAMTAEIRPRKQ
jgi:hypothetical protein